MYGKQLIMFVRLYLLWSVTFYAIVGSDQVVQDEVDYFESISRLGEKLDPNYQSNGCSKGDMKNLFDKWMTSLGPNAEVSSDMYKVHQTYLTILNMKSGEVCGADLAPAVDTIYKLNHNWESKNKYGPCVEQILNERVIECRPIHLEGLKTIESSLDKNVTDMMDHFEAKLKELNVKVDEKDRQKLFRKYFDDEVIGQALYNLLEDRDDLPDLAPILKGSAVKTISEDVIVKIYDQYIYQPGLQYYESFSAAMEDLRSVERLQRTPLEPELERLVYRYLISYRIANHFWAKGPFKQFKNAIIRATQKRIDHRNLLTKMLYKAEPFYTGYDSTTI